MEDSIGIEEVQEHQEVNESLEQPVTEENLGATDDYEQNVVEDTNAAVDEERDDAGPADQEAEENTENIDVTKIEPDSIPLKPAESRSMNLQCRMSYVPNQSSFDEYRTAPDKFMERLSQDATFQKLLEVEESPAVLFDNEKYTEAPNDPYKKAIKYLEKHGIVNLFQSLTSSVIYTMPANPLQVMVSHLKDMKLAGNRGTDLIDERGISNN